MRTRVCAYMILATICLAIVALISCSDNPTESSQRLMSLSATSLEFNSWAGRHPDPAQLKVVVMIDGEGTIDWIASVDSDWLRLGPGGSDTIFISVLSDTLPAGDYADTISVASSAATNSPLQIQVTLAVRNRLTISRDSLVFVALGGGDNPEPQTFVVSDFEGQTVSYEAATSVAWLGLENGTGIVPGTVIVSPDISGLAAGQYTGDIVISSSDLPLSQVTVHCQLNLSSWAGQDLGFGGVGVNLESVQFFDSQIGYASGWTPSNLDDPHGLVYHTQNGGETWTRVLDRHPTKFGGLAVQDADRCWVVGDAAWVEYTSNGGGDWLKSENLPLDSAVDLARVTFIGYLHGWIIGDEGTILHTENNGLDWSVQTSPTNHNLADIFFLDDQTGWIAGNHGTILHTTNAGTTWTAQNAGNTTDLRSIWFIDNQVGWVVGSQGAVRRSDDGGASWTPVAIGTNAFLLDICFASPTHGWIVGLDGEIHHTSDGGLSWLSQPTGITESLTSVYFHDENIGWVSGTSGTILKTASGGF